MTQYVRAPFFSESIFVLSRDSQNVGSLQLRAESTTLDAPVQLPPFTAPATTLRWSLAPSKLVSYQNSVALAVAEEANFALEVAASCRSF